MWSRSKLREIEMDVAVGSAKLLKLINHHNLMVLVSATIKKKVFRSFSLCSTFKEGM